MRAVTAGSNFEFDQSLVNHGGPHEGLFFLPKGKHSKIDQRCNILDISNFATTALCHVDNIVVTISIAIHMHTRFEIVQASWGPNP